MKIHIMTWNTGLFKNTNPDANNVTNIFNEVENYINNGENNGEKVVVILQEIPYKYKDERNRWGYNPIFRLFLNKFQADHNIICLTGDKFFHIKMTVVITHKQNKNNKFNAIECRDMKTTNIFVPFKLQNSSLSLQILGVHSHSAHELREWLSQQPLAPDMIIGDFNAGNYKKDIETGDFVLNRREYLMLTEGYFDLCQGENTTIYNTQIDHVLIRSDLYKKCSNLIVYKEIKLSDHFPITFDYDIDEDTFS